MNGRKLTLNRETLSSLADFALLEAIEAGHNGRGETAIRCTRTVSIYPNPDCRWMIP